MRRALIYMSAFVVSFMLMYSWYYYKNLRWLSSGYVANADTLKHTIMAPQPYQPSIEKNIIYSAGLISAMNKAKLEFTIGAKSIFDTIINEQYYSTYKGMYSPGALDKVSEETARKFPKHPPLSIQGIKDGEPMIFAYTFRNIELPSAFLENIKGIKFGNKTIRAICYNGLGEAGKTKFYFNPKTKQYALVIPIDNNEELFWYHSDTLQDIADAWKNLNSFCIQENMHVLSQGQEVVMPALDLFLEKTYKEDEMKQYFTLSDYVSKLTDDRIKLKTSAGGHTNGPKDIAANTQYIFGPSSFFCLKRKNSTFPYLGIILHNPEFLVETGR